MRGEAETAAWLRGLGVRSLCAVCPFEGKNQQAAKTMDFIDRAWRKEPVSSFTGELLS